VTGLRVGTLCRPCSHGEALTHRERQIDPESSARTGVFRDHVCQKPAGNSLQRQLVAAGLKNVTGVILEACAHSIFAENPDETLPAIIDFLSAH
jgi:hypothetical protein